MSDDASGRRLSGLLDTPEVAAVAATCPDRWVQFPCGLYHPSCVSDLREVCAGTSIGCDTAGTWWVLVDEEMIGAVFSEGPPTQDDGHEHVRAALAADPAVADAWQDDMEKYIWGWRPHNPLARPGLSPPRAGERPFEPPTHREVCGRP